MCGRAAQTFAAVRAAADILGAPQPFVRSEAGKERVSASEFGSREISPSQQTKGNDGSESTDKTADWKGDNFNLCPGMGAIVFYKDKEGTLVSESKVWGLITKHGSSTNPLPVGMGQHFSALMYNARSDTLFIKQTFGNLLSKKQSCIVALDGWFEWKQEVKGKKQPYFVKSNHRNEPFILFPGLWTKVPTGRSDQPFLDTFTILTTEVAPSLKWLHTRMPVCCFNLKLAHEWLDNPTQRLHEALLENNYSLSSDHSCRWEWHAVTDEMTSLKFRSDKAIAPWKRPTIQNFFAVKRVIESTSSVLLDLEKRDLTHVLRKNDDVNDQQEETDSIKMSSSTEASKIKVAPSGTKRPISATTSPSNGKDKNMIWTSQQGKTMHWKRSNPTSSTLSPASKKTKTTKGSITAFFSPKKKRASSSSS